MANAASHFRVVTAVPGPGDALVLGCAATIAVATLTLHLGRTPRATVAWLTALLVGMVLAAMWL